ncbi:DNA repair protein RAD10 Ecym_8154 [Eremothecium cymbalariae DBVPG|uniref:ERCC1-like central domain-containing protein n=1 Tax=Eremothecium cymbalariae (strain CBS 270.75 / DBVPG 7215 / KCTC 17166 / NRRL Y-17582) TaxID=931890 RepID=G8JX68_ERECY|nr:Hypothetical protein Ecym_8154 [Eremothecium cymbalariae DBVPG\
MGNLDATSFDSILANVKRRREEYNGGEKTDDTAVVSKSSHRTDERSSAANTIVNAFHQQHNPEPIVQEGSRKRTFNERERTILVSTTQTGNPLLKLLVNTNWRYVKSSATDKIHYDYQVHGRNVVFLSLKYHKLRPEYIGKKLQPFGKSQGNILLCVVDVEDSEDILKELNKMTMFSGFTLLLAFSFEQAGKYLIFMNK